MSRLRRTNASIINYRLRPAKQIERKMICDVLAQIKFSGRLRDYQYLGYGSVYFVDFEMFHRILGISKMFSVEREEASVRRAKFNRPFNCIEIIHSEASQYVPIHNWEVPAIVWLDETGGLDEAVLGTLGECARLAQPESILLLTVAADDPDKSGIGASDARSEFAKAVGDAINFLPDSLSTPPKRFVRGELLETIAELTTAFVQKKASSERLDQLELSAVRFLNIEYQDGRRMLTIGWILERPGEKVIERSDIKDLPFVTSELSPYRIYVPHLTPAELGVLKKFMPGEIGENVLSFIGRDELRAFTTLYQFYPSYMEVLGL